MHEELERNMLASVESSKHRYVLVLRDIEEQGRQKTAERLRVGAAGVMVRLHRTRHLRAKRLSTNRLEPWRRQA